MAIHNALFAKTAIGEGLFQIAVKDCIDIAGLPTVAGSAALADAAAAERNADVVSALLKAGCTIIGKTNMHELAYGVTGINAWTGTAVNPLFPDLVPGGSSSGSAVAVAEGLVDFAIGTDTGGSIRTPAACCGVFGLKPTFGQISREGASPRESSLDCIGPFARSKAMIETAMAMMVPDYVPRGFGGLRHVVVRPEGVDPLVLDAFDAAIAPFSADAPQAVLPGIGDAYAANIAIIAAETYAAFGHLLPSGLLGEDVAARLAAAASVDAARLAEAEAVRSRFTAAVDALLETNDVIVMPTMPCFPIPLAEATSPAEALRMTALVRPFNLSGHPALTVPVLSAQGLPVGIQVIGRRGEDEAVCAFGRLVETSTTVISFPEAKDQRP
ncbi:MAG: amidase [Sphingopyxis sp.]|nr:amidase [Sphingopyxis sp.]